MTDRHTGRDGGGHRRPLISRTAVIGRRRTMRSSRGGASGDNGGSKSSALQGGHRRAGRLVLHDRRGWSLRPDQVDAQPRGLRSPRRGQLCRSRGDPRRVAAGHRGRRHGPRRQHRAARLLGESSGPAGEPARPSWLPGGVDLKTKLRAFDLGVDDILTDTFSPESCCPGHRDHPAGVAGIHMRLIHRSRSARSRSNLPIASDRRGTRSCACPGIEQSLL